MSQGIVRSLQEMFPNHSVDTITRVVHETSGNTESAINLLLRIPQDKKPNPTRREPQTVAKPPPQHDRPQQEHIFPEDFLRWPKNVEWVCVSSDLNQSPLQSEEDILNSQQSSDPMTPLPNNSNISRGGFDTNQQLSGWAKLKSRFMTMGSGYNQI